MEVTNEEKKKYIDDFRKIVSGMFTTSTLTLSEAVIVITGTDEEVWKVLEKKFNECKNEQRGRQLKEN